MSTSHTTEWFPGHSLLPLTTMQTLAADKLKSKQGNRQAKHATNCVFLKLINGEEAQPVTTLDTSTKFSQVNMLEYFKSKVDCFKAGRLKEYYAQWQALTSDPEILQTISGQPIEFTHIPYQRVAPRRRKSTTCKKNKLLTLK